MSLSINNNEFVWTERYRPKTIDDIVLPNDLKTQIREWVQKREIPNLLLTGRIPGTGKSSLSHVLINETGADSMFLNISLYPNIDTLRQKIQGFASTSSYDGEPKIVVLDEFDGANQNSFQPAFRGFVESFSKNVTFILTANFPEKILEPIRNRMITINYDEMTQKNKAELIKAAAIRSMAILKNENIDYNKDDLIWTIKHFYPSSRKIINTFQEHVSEGVLNINREEVDLDSINDEIINYLLSKDFNNLRLAASKLSDPSTVFLTLYEQIMKFPKEKRPQIIIEIGKWQAYDSQVRDRLINAVACLVQIMEIL